VYTERGNACRAAEVGAANQRLVCSEVKPGSHKSASGKTETNQNSRKTKADKRNVSLTTIASSDWLPLSVKV